MGKKLTAKEIGQQVIEHPNNGFDQCSICKGVETQGTMTSLSDDSDEFDSFDLICDECNSKKQSSKKEDEFSVEVQRTVSTTMRIFVKAKNKEEAKTKALKEALNEDFSCGSTGEAEYSIC